MGKSDQFSSGSTAKGNICMEHEGLANIQFPLFGCWCALALQNNSIIVADGDSGGCEV